MFITNVFAAGQTSPAPSALIQFMPFILVFLVFYFLVIRPQQKKNKNHRLMLDSLKKGDQIITSGGIFGTVQRIYEGQNYVQLEISDKINVKIQKHHIIDVVKEINNKSN